MGSTNEELLNSIRYYQRNLDKYTSFGNSYKLIGILEKLKRLPIATSHLEETGIGRTVNALRKLGGEVGEVAKILVATWKEMVVQEERRVKESESKDIANEACVSENDNDCYEEKENSCKEEEDEDSQIRKKKSSSSHRLSDTEKKSSEKHESIKNRYSSNNDSGSSHEKKDKHEDTDNSSKKRRKSSSSNDEHNSKRQHDSSSFDSEEGGHDRNHSKTSSKRNKESESSENEEEEDGKRISKKSKHSKHSSDSEDSYKKHKSSKSSRDNSSRKSKSREKTESKKREYDSSSDREADKSKSKHRSHSKLKRESDCDEDVSSTKHNSKNYESSSDNEEAKHKSKHSSKSRHDKDSSKSRESKSHSSRSDKHEKKDKKEGKPDESKEKHSHKRSESRTHEEKHKKSKEEKETGKKQKSSTSCRQEESSKPSSSSSKHKSSSDKKKDKVKPPNPVYTEKIINGIDSGSGASFAEALGMCGPMVSKSASSNKKKSSLPMNEKPRTSSSYVRPEKTETVEEDIVPNLLKEQPQEPININISSLLPDITPNYRPLGFPIDSQPKKVLSQDEALSQVISNKNIMRTKVYSGNKSFGKVDTLFDLCVRILQDNIDALEYTGGVPFLILKPVLERATPDQLFNMEHHNPYLIEDTDDLWQLHCQKEFRNKKREELESWREMYMRCLNEREARLNAITANIKQSQDNSIPIRTTKLAYVDSVVKPPRNVARKQAKNGIAFDKKPAQTPASRVAALSSHGDAGKVAVPNPGNRAVEQRSSSSATAIKPKKAPLMAKTLSFLKNRFRR